MAKKSRLGKGVGALFPTLPTFEENAGDVSFNEGQKHGFEGRDASDSPKRLHGKDTSYSNGQNVSRETSDFCTGCDADKEADETCTFSSFFSPAFTAGALRLGILIAETFCGFDKPEGFRVSAEDS